MLKSKKALAILGILGIFFLNNGVALADTASVSMTASIKAISITITDGAIDFGALETGTTKSASSLSDAQTITNTGTVAASLYWNGTNSTNWTLVNKESLGNQDEYALQYKWNDGAFINLTPVSTYYGNDIGKTGVVTIDFSVTTPTSVSGYTSQNFSVDVMAVEL